MRYNLNNISEEEKNAIREQHQKTTGTPTTQKTSQQFSGMWSKFPCTSKLKDVVSPNGEKSKRGDGIFKDILFYPNGRCMDITNKSMAFYKCIPGGGIVISDDPNFDINTVE